MNSKKLFYEDAYLKEFESKVICCEPVEQGFATVLSMTAFYPEGGGQPFDIGKIGDANVLEVHEKDGEIIHLTDSALEPDKTYNCTIDWNRRYDHMQRHTAEHIVSGIIHKLYGADNVGFNIGTEYVTMDYNVFLTDEDIKKIEHLSNEAVFKNLPVQVDFYDGTPDIAYRSKKQLTGEIRIVNISDYDVCACCGTQTRTTGELGLIKIVQSQKYKSGSRLSMVCGYRALEDYDVKQRNAHEISTLLSSKINESAEAVKVLLAERDKIKYQLTQSKIRILEFITASQPEEETVSVFEDDLGPDELKRLALMIAEKSEKTLISAAFSGDDENGYKYAIIYKKGDIKEFSTALNNALNGRGGGKDILMGSVQKNRQDIEDFLNKL